MAILQVLSDDIHNNLMISMEKDLILAKQAYEFYAESAEWKPLTEENLTKVVNNFIISVLEDYHNWSDENLE